MKSIAFAVMSLALVLDYSSSAANSKDHCRPLKDQELAALTAMDSENGACLVGEECGNSDNTNTLWPENSFFCPMNNNGTCKSANQTGTNCGYSNWPGPAHVTCLNFGGTGCDGEETTCGQQEQWFCSSHVNPNNNQPECHCGDWASVPAIPYGTRSTCTPYAN